MGGVAEISTDRGLGLQWWHVVAAGTGAWALLVWTTDLEWLLGPGLSDAVVTLALLAWPAIPVAMYLDLRAIRRDTTWEPATKSWLLASLVPIANVPVGTAYCVRRRYAVRGELPSPNWRYGVYVGLLAWVGVVAVDGAVEYVDVGVLEPIVFGPVLYVVWLGFPVALYFDLERVRAYIDTSPNVRVVVALSVVPLLNLLIGVAYLGSRWWHLRKVEPDAEPTLDGDTDTGATRPEPVSPWYRRAAGVFVVYFLVVLAVGLGLGLESDGAWLGLELVGWLPFGLFFTACLHFDLRDVQDAGVSWGGTRYLYYSSAVFPGPAFYYLLRRLLKVNRAREKGRLDDDAGGDRDEDGGDRNLFVQSSGPTRATDETPGKDRTDFEDGAGFDWGEGSRG